MRTRFRNAMVHSFTRMEAAVQLLQSLAGHVGVNFSCADTGMAKHFLDGAKVSTILEQMRGEAVPEHVRGDVFFDSATFHPFFNMQPHGHARESSAAAREKNCAGRTRFDQLRTRVAKI